MNWIFGSNINTDLITPGRYNITTDPHDLAKIAFIEHRPEFAKKVKTGDFLVAGDNFGCGSSRETAVVAIKYCGISAILAPSYARIFYRNCMNLGQLAVIVETKNISKNDSIMLDTKKNILINKTKNTQQPIIIPSIMLRLHKEGGIISYLKKNGLSSLSDLGKF